MKLSRFVYIGMLLISISSMAAAQNVRDRDEFSQQRNAFGYWLGDKSMLSTKATKLRGSIQHYRNASVVMLDMFLTDKNSGWKIHYTTNYDFTGREIPPSIGAVQVSSGGQTKEILTKGFYFIHKGPDSSKNRIVVAPAVISEYYPGDGRFYLDIVQAMFHGDDQELIDSFADEFERYSKIHNIYRFSVLEFAKDGFQAQYLSNVEDMGVEWKNLILDPHLKKVAYQQTEGFLKEVARFNQFKVQAKKGVILEGPPGTGKSLLGQIMISSIQDGDLKGYGTMITVTARHLIYRNSVRRMFQVARDMSPGIVFMEDIDLLGIQNRGGNVLNSDSKDEILNELLNSIDGVVDNSGILVVGTTNRVSSVDPALKRSLRLGVHLHFGLPLFAQRKEFFDKFIGQKSTLEKDLDSDQLAAVTERLSGADLVEIIALAKQRALLADSWQGGKLLLTWRYFEKAIERIRANVGEDDSELNYGSLVPGVGNLKIAMKLMHQVNSQMGI